MWSGSLQADMPYAAIAVSPIPGAAYFLFIVWSPREA
jgi:hypothetical protein